jgi:hypothetical protein
MLQTDIHNVLMSSSLNSLTWHQHPGHPTLPIAKAKGSFASLLPPPPLHLPPPLVLLADFQPSPKVAKIETTCLKDMPAIIALIAHYKI